MMLKNHIHLNKNSKNQNIQELLNLSKVIAQNEKIDSLKKSINILYKENKVRTSL